MPWILQNQFPDTANFGNDIMTCRVNEINAEMETYALLVLALFTSYRNINDLSLNGSHTLKLRQFHIQGKLKQYEWFLQNLQNSNANFLRVKERTDKLQSITQPFKIPGSDVSNENEENIDDEAIELALQGLDLNDILERIDQAINSEIIDNGRNENTSNSLNIRQVINFDKIKAIGNNKHGNEKLGDVTTSDFLLDGNQGSFVKINHTTQEDDNNENNDEIEPIERKKPTRNDIVEVYFSRKSLIEQTNNFGDDEVTIKVPEAMVLHLASLIGAERMDWTMNNKEHLKFLQVLLF